MFASAANDQVLLHPFATLASFKSGKVKLLLYHQGREIAIENCGRMCFDFWANVFQVLGRCLIGYSELISGAAYGHAAPFNNVGIDHSGFNTLVAH